MVHWFDELLAHVRASVEPKRELVINGGLSVSGLQHVGRLRGEIVLCHCLARALREEGRVVTQALVQYTQDQWKGKEWQLSQFPGDSGREHVGRRLIDVPDPHRCHENWVVHYWAEFSEYLPAYAPDVRITSTTDLYRREDMRRLAADLAGRAEEVRAVVNKYRARKPYAEGWIPFEPYCNACRRVGNARAIRIHGIDTVDYECECGDRGTSKLELGKLNWRLEWPAIWKVLAVDVEPFGKDHAAPGGSRDSCREIARTVLGFEPPFGIPYEFVGLGERAVDKGDMGSSDAIGFGPATWDAIGDPEVLRYTYLSVPVVRRVVLDLGKADVYHDAYDAGSGAYHSEDASEEAQVHRRTFALAAMHPPPATKPFVLAYRHAAYLSQISPEEGGVDWVLRRLRDTGMLRRELTADECARVAGRLGHARRWVERHSPESRVELLDALTDSVRAQLTAEDRESLRMYVDRARAAEWQEDAIKESMVSLTRSGGLPVDTPRFFRNLYLVLLGREKGPRAAPFVAVLEKTFVLDRLRDASNP